MNNDYLLGHFVARVMINRRDLRTEVLRQVESSECCDFARGVIDQVESKSVNSQAETDWLKRIKKIMVKNDPLFAHAADCAVALNARHSCSCGDGGKDETYKAEDEYGEGTHEKPVR